MGFDFGGQCGWCVVDGSLLRWLMGLTAIGLGWRFVDGLFVGLARFWVWIGAVVAVSCDCGCWWWFLAIFCVSFPLGGCFLWLLLVVSLVVVVVVGQWNGGGKVAIFMWLFLLWLGFGFVYGGEERETGEEGREREN